MTPALPLRSEVSSDYFEQYKECYAAIMKMPTLNTVLNIEAILGESPLWSVEEGVLYWLDCLRPAIYRFNPLTGENNTTILDQIVTSIALHSPDYLLVTVEQGYAFANLKTGKLDLIADPYAKKAVIFNDGKCDRKGRFWSGTAAKDWQSPIGTLFQLTVDLSFKPMAEGFILSNGIGFSPDNKYLYFADSVAHSIYRFDFDLQNGIITNKKRFINIPDTDGLPDGLTVDADGFLWVAMWDGACINRYSPQGEKTSSIQLPIPRPTSVAFGDHNLSTLYVTSARMGLSDDQLRQSPASGNLFAIKTAYCGLPEPHFKANTAR